MLQLKKLGIDDLVHFDFMDPPGMNSQHISSNLLTKIGCLSLYPIEYIYKNILPFSSSKHQNNKCYVLTLKHRRVSIM